MVSFLQACREFFGYKPDQKAIDFAKEVKFLTNDDRREIADGLKKNGFDIDPSTIVSGTANV